MGIRKYLKHKLYNIVKGVERELQYQQIQELKNRFSAVGKNFSIEDGFDIGGAQYITIGDNFHACRFLRIGIFDRWNQEQFTPSLTLGNDIYIESNCHIGCIDNITIGNGTIIGRNVLITDHYHGQISKEDLKVKPFDRPLHSKPVRIGSNVWIGEGVCIMPGVELGDNVIVGANSVVTHSFEADTVIAGCPARMIKKLV